jgi:beta-alanine degradation protein BauB
MKRNVGGTDETAGFLIASAGLTMGLFAKRGWLKALGMAIGLAELATAVTRYSPLNELLDRNTAFRRASVHPLRDPVFVTPSTHKTVLENEQVRVLDIHVEPGATAPMHSHPAYAFYALTPLRVRFTYPDGKSEVIEAEAGAVGWREAETHSVENLGTNELHVLNFELKAEQQVRQPAQQPKAA